MLNVLFNSQALVRAEIGFRCSRVICLTLNQDWESRREGEMESVNFKQFGGALAVFVEVEKKQVGRRGAWGRFSYTISDFWHRVV